MTDRKDLVNKPCPECGVLLSKICTAPDPCTGALPGMWNACCGHGIESMAYLQFGRDKSDCIEITGLRALHIMRCMREALGKVHNPLWEYGGQTAEERKAVNDALFS